MGNGKATQVFSMEPCLPIYSSGKKMEEILLPPSCTYDPSLYKIELECEVEKRRHDSEVDMKKLKRTVSNKLSAQRTREKRAKYTLILEKKVEEYKLNNLWILTPQVDWEQLKKDILLRENMFLKKELQMMENKEILRDLKEQALRLEKQRLKELEIGNIHDPNPEAELDLNLVQTQQPYPTLSFYEERMQNLPFHDSSSFEQFAEDAPHMAEDLAVESNQELAMEEEEDVDQYLNFDEVNLDDIDFC